MGSFIEIYRSDNFVYGSIEEQNGSTTKMFGFIGSIYASADNYVFNALITDTSGDLFYLYMNNDVLYMNGIDKDNSIGSGTTPVLFRAYTSDGHEPEIPEVPDYIGSWTGKGCTYLYSDGSTSTAPQVTVEITGQYENLVTGVISTKFGDYDLFGYITLFQPSVMTFYMENDLGRLTLRIDDEGNATMFVYFNEDSRILTSYLEEN